MVVVKRKTAEAAITRVEMEERISPGSLERCQGLASTWKGGGMGTGLYGNTSKQRLETCQDSRSRGS